MSDNTDPRQSLEHQPEAELSPGALTSLRFLRHRLEQAAATGVEGDAFLTRAAQVLSSAVGQECLAWATIEDDEVRLTGLNLPIEGLAEEVQRLLADRSREAMRAQLTHVSDIVGKAETKCVCAPVAAGNGVLIVLQSAGQRSLPFVVAAAELAASCIGAAGFRQASSESEADAVAAGALVDLLGRVEAADDLKSSGRAFCQELCELFAADKAFVGLIDDTEATCTLLASAENSTIDNELTRIIEAALHESTMRTEPAACPPLQGAPRHGLLAHRQLLSRLHAECAVSTPLRTEEGKLRGALLVVGSTNIASERTLRFLEAGEPRMAGSIGLLQRAERKGLERRIVQLRSIFSGRTGVLLTLSAIAIAAIMCIPMPYKVKTNCELQPVNRRFVAAPFEGALDHSFVEPGDIVEADKLLAKMDGREIQLQLSEAASEYDRASKQSDIHRSKREYGAAQMAEKEAEAFQARKDLFEHRASNLEIRSPTSGIVVSGDWSKSDGIPLSVGETLFEIAPLDRMTVEIGIPEEDILHVRVNQEVVVHLDAFSGRSWKGTIKHIHPAAEMKDKEHVFIAEVELANESLELRPGMRGKAKIITSKRPLFWNVFHKPWNRLVTWLRYAI